MRLRHHILCWTWISLMACVPSPIAGLAAEGETAPIQNQNEFDAFSALRTEILGKIAGATKRVWITTDFLTDAEIVSSLYIAQYRKVNIQVLLGKDRATNILSRINYLKQVNIPVAIRPRAFYVKSPTIMLIDDKLISINSDLDYLSKVRKFKITELGTEEIVAFEASFQDAAKNQDTPSAPPLPLVGHQRSTKSKPAAPKPVLPSGDGQPIQTTITTTDQIESAQPAELNTEAKPTTSLASGEAQGVYRYRSIRERPDSGVPTKLPKMTIREKNKASSTDKSEPPSTESP